MLLECPNCRHVISTEILRQISQFNYPCPNCRVHPLSAFLPKPKRFDTWTNAELTEERDRLLVELFEDGAGYHGGERLAGIQTELRRRGLLPNCELNKEKC